MSWENWRKNEEVKYHHSFKWRGPLCLKRSKGLCLLCKAQNGSIRENGSVVKLAAAHLRHDYWNPRALLAALCQSCHNQWDAENRNKNKHNKKRKKEREEAIEDGQIANGWKTKGDQDKLMAKTRNHMFVDIMWELRNFSPKSKQTKKKSPEAKQLSLLLDNEEDAYPIMQVDFPITEFLQAVPS